MLFVEKLSNAQQIVACFGKMFRLAGGFFAATGGFDVKVGHVPRLDSRRKAFAALNRSNWPSPLIARMSGASSVWFTSKLFIRLVEVLLVRDRVAASSFEVQNVIRFAMTPAFVPEKFPASRKGWPFSRQSPASR